MTKKILFLTLISLFILSFTGTLLAAEVDIVIDQIRYKLDGSDLVTVDITPVTVTTYDDGSAHAPVELYSFPEALEGTITEMDIHLSTGGDTQWYCAVTEGAQTLNQYFSGDGDPNTGSGIEVTSNTTEVYIGFRGEEGQVAQIVSPGTE